MTARVLAKELHLSLNTIQVDRMVTKFMGETDVLYYKPPNKNERKQLIENVLGTFKESKFAWKMVLSDSEGLSHAEIDLACRDAIKTAILGDISKVNATLLRKTLRNRQDACKGLRGNI